MRGRTVQLTTADVGQAACHRTTTNLYVWMYCMRCIPAAVQGRAQSCLPVSCKESIARSRRPAENCGAYRSMRAAATQSGSCCTQRRGSALSGHCVVQVRALGVTRAKGVRRVRHHLRTSMRLSACLSACWSRAGVTAAWSSCCKQHGRRSGWHSISRLHSSLCKGWDHGRECHAA
jgi:hypothetical protein